MIWNETIECMDRESLRKIQSIRLKKIVDYVYHNTPFYRKKMQEMGVTHIVECGPGRVLAGLVRRIAPEITVANVSDMASVKNVIAQLNA